ncbi:hypothetical protein GQ42DRAFT_5372 [Ramicandelaber brevisporus]|nr:hypothetical protein GQ42DRAFT_5372 [Ramicandelaber brevisporus]
MTSTSNLRLLLRNLAAHASDDDLFELSGLLLHSGPLTRNNFTLDNRPFRLLDLPLELLEEIALFFTRAETLDVLTVNRLLHAVFARVAVWRRLSEEKLNQLTPNSVWDHYGHLVRVAILSVSVGHYDMHRWTPSLVRLHVDIMRTPADLFGRQEMPLLRHAQIVLNSRAWRLSDADRVARWINKAAAERDQYVFIEWTIAFYTAQNLAFIDTILALPNAERYNSVVAEFIFHAGLAVPSLDKFAVLVKELTVGIRTRENNFFVVAHALFGSDSVSYPNLRRLVLNSLSRPSAVYSLDNFAPSRMPSIRAMYIILDSSRDDESCLSVFANTWPSIKELSLTNCRDRALLDLMLRQTPNIERLFLRGLLFPVDLQLLVRYVPHLQQLGFSHDMQMKLLVSQNQPSSNLAELRELYFYSGSRYTFLFDLTPDFFHVTFDMAPNLYSIEMANCRDRKNFLENIKDHVNPSVRSLLLKHGKEGFTLAQIKKLITMFPGLKWLKIVNGEVGVISHLQSRYPSIRIANARVSDKRNIKLDD